MKEGRDRVADPFRSTAVTDRKNQVFARDLREATALVTGPGFSRFVISFEVVVHQARITRTDSPPPPAEQPKGATD